jgi:hypothetical protein
MKNLPRLLVLSSVVASSFVATTREAHATLLSYWNFNNVSPSYLSGNGTLGSFSTSSAAYGEAYVQTNNSTAGSLRGNTANNTVYNSASIGIDFSNLGTIATPLINGKTNASTYASQGNTNSAFGGYGSFLDSTVNRVNGDSTTGGSLIVMNPSGAAVGKYVTFSLSSLGYDTLSLSYATRISASTTGTETWSYSLDGTNFSSLTSLTSLSQGSFGTQTLNLSSLSGSALDNQSSFYLRMTIGTGTSASYAFDNFQLTGTASAIPEPSTFALLGGLGALGFGLSRRRR